MRDALGETLASGDELGASIVINVGREVVADIWGGFRDEARTVPWTEDTITNVCSTTKTIANLAAMMLAGRGLLDVVRHLLSPTSGVSGWDSRSLSYSNA